MKLSGPFSYNAFLCTIRTILELGDNVFLTPLAEQMKVAKAYIMVGAVLERAEGQYVGRHENYAQHQVGSQYSACSVMMDRGF